MEMSKSHWTGIGFGVVFLIIALVLSETKVFFLFVGLGFIVALAPFVFSIMHENRIASEKEEMFLEFSRNLVESVKAGTPISKSILNVKGRAYGELSPHIKKLVQSNCNGYSFKCCSSDFFKRY